MRKKGGVRNSDPDTSHEAAERVDVTKCEQKALDFLLKVFPQFYTAIEISIAVGIDKWSISPRLKPLEEKGKVERVGKKVTINSNGRTSSQIAWRAIP